MTPHPIYPDGLPLPRRYWSMVTTMMVIAQFALPHTERAQRSLNYVSVILHVASFGLLIGVSVDIGRHVDHPS